MCLFHLKSLTTFKGGKASFGAKLHSNRTRINGLKLLQERFKFDIRKNFVTEIGMTLEQGAQASGGGAIPGSVQEMTPHGTLCYGSVHIMLFGQRLVFFFLAF